jgi:uncharacterized OB-fold protein
VTVQQIPVAQDLFSWTDDSAALVGSRCSGCSTYYFPQSLSCRNPACIAKQVERTEFGAEGRLYSYTVQSYRPPALFRTDDWAPYAIGLVDLPEGVRVLAMLTGCAPDDLAIDMPLALTVRPLYTAESGEEVVTYMYQPAGAGAAA